MIRRPLLQLLGLLVLAGGLSACQGEATVTNGPAGDQRVRWAPPWNTQPKAARSSHRTTTTHPPAPGVPSTVEECEECEGGACQPTPFGR